MTVVYSYETKNIYARKLLVTLYMKQNMILRVAILPGKK